MSYYESVKENAEEYLKHVPSQGITHKYEYTNILIGTTIMQLLSVIADELHEMNKKETVKKEAVNESAIPIEYIHTFIMNEIKNRDKYCKGSSSWEFANERALILQSLIDVWLGEEIEK